LIRHQKIKILQDEKILFDELTKCAVSNNVVLRVAGGWVRDKIIGLPNVDIDIVIESMSGKAMSGKDFSEKLIEYIEFLGNGWSCKKAANGGANESNTLETATLKITLPNKVEFELDFVGLRKETYNEGSRIPVIETASPKEDASRRDITINSLFYNINTQLIEDYIGGVRDIKRKIIRTPLDAMKTLCDDPLRMLRALRFLSRFQFMLDSNIQNVMKSQKFKESFTAKVSKDRIGQEIEGFFKGSSVPFLAFNEIHKNELWNDIFGGVSDWGARSIEILKKLTDRTKETVLSALSLPLAEIDNKLLVDRKSKAKAKTKTNVQIFYSEKLRLVSELSNKIENIHRCIFSIKELDKDIASWKRSTIGIIMFNAKDCFDNALNIINAQDEKLYTNLSVFICEKK
jgi:tRNA nucleotidyltransferase/poly(A) polymerase